jgi:hypothetical protein
MALDANDLRARQAHRRRAQEVARTAGPAITIGRWLSEQMAAAAGWDSIGRRLSEQMAAAAGWDSIGGYGRQVQSMLNQLTMAVGVQPPHDVLPEEDALMTIAPSVQSPVIEALVIRVILAAVIQSLIVAMWQEGRDSTPAAALSAIFGVIVAWYQLDEAIWKRFSE